MTMWMVTVAVAVALAVVVALVLIWLGYQLAVGRLRDAHTDIARQQAALDAEWWQLDQTRRIRSIFFAARRAMQYEANHHLWPPDPSSRNRNETQEDGR
jgi:hypothetical protein